MLSLHALTNVPLSSAHTWTPFHHPRRLDYWIIDILIMDLIVMDSSDLYTLANWYPGGGYKLKSSYFRPVFRSWSEKRLGSRISSPLFTFPSYKAALSARLIFTLSLVLLWVKYSGDPNTEHSNNRTINAIVPWLVNNKYNLSAQSCALTSCCCC